MHELYRSCIIFTREISWHDPRLRLASVGHGNPRNEAIAILFLGTPRAIGRTYPNGIGKLRTSLRSFRPALDHYPEGPINQVTRHCDPSTNGFCYLHPSYLVLGP